MTKRILVSISGGRTSAMMAVLIKKLYSATHEIIYVFANTGKEREETLRFLDKVDKYFRLGVVWIESQVHYNERKSSTFKIVSFKTADREGETFENVIKKYGIPNVEFKHCTRELKTNPIQAYAKSIEWKDYKVAIGYRADEPKRINWEKVKLGNHIYPLAEKGIKKEDVNLFWSNQPFDLELKSYEGNCDLCYKKSKRKLLTIIKEHPYLCNWWGKMEARYERFSANDSYGKKFPYRFYRENDSITDLIEESKLPFDMSRDESKILNTQQLMNFNVYMDEQSECSESCEPF